VFIRIGLSQIDDPVTVSCEGHSRRFVPTPINPACVQGQIEWGLFLQQITRHVCYTCKTVI